MSGPALGRPGKGEARDKTQDCLDKCERVKVERRFSLAKCKCGMGLVTAKLRETAAHVIAMSVLVLNLRKIQCALGSIAGCSVATEKIGVCSVDIIYYSPGSSIPADKLMKQETAWPIGHAVSAKM